MAEVYSGPPGMAAEFVGTQLRSRVLASEPTRSHFTGPAAFLCGTVNDDEATRSARIDDAEDWAIE